MRPSLLASSALAAALVASSAGAATAGVTDAEVVFGMVGPFSGGARELGRQAKIGLELAFAAANEAGGVHGRRLRLVALDDGDEPARATAAAKELLDGRKVFGLVGHAGTATVGAVLPLVLERRVLFYGALSGERLLRNEPPDRTVFNYRASYLEETTAAVRYLVEALRIPPEAIAVFAQEDAFGDAGAEGVAKMVRGYGHDPTRTLRVGYRRNGFDVEAAVRTLKQQAGRLRAVVMVATSRAAAKFIEKVKDAGAPLVFTNVSSVGSNDLADELVPLGARYADGVIVTQVVPLPSSGSSAVIRYRDLLARHAPGERPDFVSLEGYVAGSLLVKGLERAGKDLRTDALVDALEGLRGLDLGFGGTLGFGPGDHQASRKVWGTVLDGTGNYRTLDLEGGAAPGPRVAAATRGKAPRSQAAAPRAAARSHAPPLPAAATPRNAPEEPRRAEPSPGARELAGPRPTPTPATTAPPAAEEPPTEDEPEPPAAAPATVAPAPPSTSAPAAPPPPSAPTGPVRYAPGMMAPVLVSSPPLEYTPKALEREVEGVIVADCLVTVEGAVRSCRVVKSIPLMDGAVIWNLEHRRYRPASLDGQPLDVEYTFVVKLTLPR